MFNTIKLCAYGIQWLICNNHRPFLELLIEMIINAGPVFIKIGQVLSTRTDLFPDHVIEHLSILRENVPPMDKKKLDSVIQKYEDLLEGLRIEPEPIACGCIAQTHICTMPDNTKAIIKIKRANILEDSVNSFKKIQKYLSWLDKIPYFHTLGVLERFNNIEKSIIEQTNFNIEFENLKYFHKTYQNNSLIITPEPFEKYCNTDLICMEYLESVDDYSLEDTKEFGKLYVKFMVLGMFVHGTFHCDMHRGNVVAMRREGKVKLGVIDFGFTYKFSEKDFENGFEYYYAIIEKDWDKAADLVKNFICESTVKDHEYFDKEIRKVLKESFNEDVWDPIGYTSKMSITIKKAGTVMKKTFAIWELAMVTGQGTLSQLQSGQNIWDLCKEINVELGL